MSIIDISHWQATVDWPEVAKSGVIGCLHKFSQDGEFRDPAYAGRVDAAKAAGLLWGRYHYGDSSDVQAQVTNFLHGWKEDEALALDWEDDRSQMTVSQAMTFVGEAAKRTGVLPILYSGNTLKGHVARGAYLGALRKCRLWLPQYGRYGTVPPGWPAFWLWQYTSSGTVPGIGGPVDVSRYVDEAELRATWAPRPVLIAGSGPPGIT